MKRYERRFPCVEDMQSYAERKIPGFAWEYLTGGIGRETNLARNRNDLDAVKLWPRYAEGAGDRPDMGVKLFGREYSAPFGVAPMGFNGLIWPGSEKPIAAAARAQGIVHVLSTHATQELAEMKKISAEVGWYQLYALNTPEGLTDQIRRVAAAGYDVMVVTVDIPGPVRRVRDIRNGLSVPPKFGLKTVYQAATRPHWLIRLARHGLPHFRNLERYAPPNATIDEMADFLGSLLAGHITLERFRFIRDLWQGPLIVKGLLDADEAAAFLGAGADAIIVSNHGGRQLDAAPSTAAALPAFRARLGPQAQIFVDGGVRSGLDVARMIALGADFVFIGRPFMYAATLGDDGAAHLIDVLKLELTAALQQLGAPHIAALPRFLHRP